MVEYWRETALTQEEHDYVLNNMKALLMRFGYNFTENALEKIIYTFATNKDTLIRAIKRHPNYVDGKLMIAVTRDYPRKFDIDQANLLMDWMRSVDTMRKLMNVIPDSKKEKYIRRKASIALKYDDSINAFDVLNIDVRSALIHAFRYQSSKLIDEEMRSYINERMPEVNATDNMKFSRMIGKIANCIGYDKIVDMREFTWTDNQGVSHSRMRDYGWNKEFAAFADCVNPLDIKRHTILSVNPLDYLTMSFGNSWASCHTIDVNNIRQSSGDHYHGMYSSGTISYMLDGTSMVLYTVDASYDGNEFWNEDKITRQMFHFGDTGVLVQGRLYPQSNDGENSVYTPYREFVQKVLADTFNFNNRWTTKRGTSAAGQYIITRGTHYVDYDHYDSCTCSKLVDYDKDYESFIVGHKPISIVTGDEHGNAENIMGYDDRYETCWCCEDTFRESVMQDVYVSGRRRRFCERCVENHTEYCECCNTTVYEDDIRYVDSYGEYVCDDCVDSYFTTCEDCGELVHNDYTYSVNDDETIVCDTCYQDCVTCEDCQDVYTENNIVVHEDTCRCRACHTSFIDQNDLDIA